MRARVFLSILVSVLLSSQASVADIWIVKDDGSGDAVNIQAGIDSCAVGDTVLVYPGTYSGYGNRELEFRGKAITVISSRSYDAGVTSWSTIEGEAYRAFYLQQYEDTNSVIDGFEISTNTLNTPGIHCLISSPKIKNCWIHGTSPAIRADSSSMIVEYTDITSFSGLSGTGIECSASSMPIIRHNSISGSNENSGGIWLKSGTSATIFGNTIEIDGGDFGSGIYITDSSADIYDNDFGPIRGLVGNCIYADDSDIVITNNVFHGSGGGANYTLGSGLYCDNTTVNMSGNDLYDNDAGFSYCIYIRNSPYSSIVDNNITSNYSGGIYFSGDLSSVISGNLIEDNTEMAGISCHSSIQISNNVIIGNNIHRAEPSSNSCGIICDSCSPTIEYNIIAGNYGYDGGGIYCEDANPNLYRNTIYGNRARRGVGIFCDSSSDPTILSTVISSNTRSIRHLKVVVYTLNHRSLRRSTR